MKKIVFFLEKLSSKPRIDGLEINEGSISYAYLEYDKPKTLALRLPPGIFKDNKLAEPDQLLKYLKQVHESVIPNEPDKMLRVTVVLPPSMVYTQSFTVPNVGSERLKETSTLNLQMISPIPVPQANMSAQVINETPDRYEMLGAFTDRNSVTQIKDILIQAGFAPIAFEFPALSITRLIRGSSVSDGKSALVFHVSSEGLDIFILRNGELHFDYFRSWKSIQGEERSISREVFDGVVAEEVRKVVNFSVSRFNETPAAALIIAPGFEAEIGEVMAKVFNLRAVPLVLNQTPSVFYVALGAAMRGKLEVKEDGDLKIINLGGESLTKTIYNEQILNFIGLWRNITASSFTVLLVAFIFSASFLLNQYKGLTNQLSEFSAKASQKELADLANKAEEFNGMISAIRTVRGSASPWHETLSHLESVASTNHIKLTSLDISSLTSPVSAFGTAADYSSALAFKNALLSDPGFMNVNMPLTQITPLTGGAGVSFNITFSFKI
ncbi:MAG: hypothetical protein ABSE68_03265 [Minisyncoccia bacterium]